MRNTDDDWRSIADSHPYYGVLSNERFLAPQADDLVEFFASGEQDVAHVRNIIERQFGAFGPKSVLDFGCGVGRLTIPLAKFAGSVTGVDIAEGMLTLARQHAAEASLSIEFVTDIPSDRQFDWVNTYIVLQHIPPARGYGIIARLWAAVARGGMLSYHVTVYKDQRHTYELQRDLTAFRYDGETLVRYPDHQADVAGMSMYDYDLSRVFHALDLADGDPVFMEATDHGGCHGFRIYVQKR